MSREIEVVLNETDSAACIDFPAGDKVKMSNFSSRTFLKENNISLNLDCMKELQLQFSVLILQFRKFSSFRDPIICLVLDVSVGWR